ncbi:hypothetical protein J6590_006749 [Homalodisca vitripennis]|nr:hypothetical protein J6590_006749 [Homalodisca vitripennis]
MAAVSSVKTSLTLLDGTTYQKEFPAWVSAPTGKIFINDKATQQTPAAPTNKNVYYESLKPIFITLTLAGILPVFRLRVGSHKVQLFLVGGVCLTVYVLLAYLTYLVTKDILYLIFHDDDFSSIVVQVILIMLLMQHAFYLILTWPESLAVNKYLIEWKDFQIQYEAVTGNKLMLTCRKKVVIAICAVALLAAAFPYIIDKIDDKSITNNIAYVVLAYHIFIQQCFYILWFSNSWAITLAADQFNSQLALECSMDISPERLEDYRLMWVKLTELVRMGSSMLSYTMALMITTPFAYEVIAAYNLTMFVIVSVQQGRLGNAQEAIAIASTFLFFGILLYMFCNSGHWMTVKVR